MNISSYSMNWTYTISVYLIIYFETCMIFYLCMLFDILGTPSICQYEQTNLPDKKQKKILMFCFIC